MSWAASRALRTSVSTGLFLHPNCPHEHAATRQVGHRRFDFNDLTRHVLQKTWSHPDKDTASSATASMQTVQAKTSLGVLQYTRSPYVTLGAETRLGCRPTAAAASPASCSAAPAAASDTLAASPCPEAMGQRCLFAHRGRTCHDKCRDPYNIREYLLSRSTFKKHVYCTSAHPVTKNDRACRG